jgi:hypothetical protein
MKLIQTLLLTALAVSNFGMVCMAEEKHHAVIFQANDIGSFTASAYGTSGALLTQDTASGEGSHIGRYTLAASEIINPDLTIVKGSFTLTTTDGNTLSGTYAGQGSPGTTPGVITWEVCGPITGGTGRFQEATGMVCFTGAGSVQTGMFAESSVGLIFSDDK